MKRTRLSRLVEARGLKMCWLARKIGIHRSNVSRWVAGTRPIPDAHRTKLAALLGVDPDTINN
jgi:plasmid maintenance system antidote protein VapI